MTPTSLHRSRRDRRTRFSVKLADFLSRHIITIGGVGTIGAVLMVFVFLLFMVAPLFRPSAVGEVRPMKSEAGAAALRRVWIDEYRSVACALLGDGSLVAFRHDTGEALERRAAPAGAAITAWNAGIGDEQVIFGFSDGTARLGSLGFSTSYLAEGDLGAALRGMKENEAATDGSGLITRTPQGQWRRQSLKFSLGEPLDLDPASSAPARLIDAVMLSQGPILAALTGDDRLLVESSRTRKNLLTGKETVTTTVGRAPYEPRPGAAPAYLFLDGLGVTLTLVWSDGYAVRYDIRDIERPQEIQRLDLVKEEGQSVTAATLLIGRTTLLVGDSTGRVKAWFSAPPVGDEESPKRLLQVARRFFGAGAPVTCLATSSRMRMLAAGFADGSARVWHATSGKLLAEFEGEAGRPMETVAFAPKDDGLLLSAGEHWTRVDFDPRHPEASVAALFAPVWYEGYARPMHIWQSSAATDDFEPKLGMIPLIFGTLKATLYSMLFGLPLALLAAIYTSEFMHPRVKMAVKPTVELMASLPSVVLGFLAALVVAPFIERWIPATLLSFLTLPLAFLVGAHLWQLLPNDLARHWARLRFPFIMCVAPLGVALAVALGPGVERAFFEGDIKLWLDGRGRGFGSPTGGWLLLLLPVGAVVAALVMARWVNPWMGAMAQRLAPGRYALLDLAKFAVLATLTVVCALVMSWLLGLRFDPRGAIVDTYVQRNALIVGFAMGFAIIPIIYTIAEDALSTVPAHLRSASLGAGATPWQTAVRIVIPTAMSGLFSATMIGLGRAVGETMIVLMAAGNTPVLDLNVFNGFRTLSANIAVEMPEAVRDSTHYRTLFLAALTLFAMTFVVNTVAEVVRLRFRKRAFEL